MHCIPDVPKDIQNQIERENLITQKALWQTKSVNLNELAKAKTNSTLFLDKLNSMNNIVTFNDDEEKSNQEESDNLLI